MNDLDFSINFNKYDQMININERNLSKLEERDRIRLINSLSGPKSVHLIGTKSGDKLNLSIVSSIFHLGASPALFGFVIRPDTVTRDTLNNLRMHPHLTINQVHQGIIEEAHQTSARYNSNQSEFEMCHLTEEFLEDHDAPFVKESKIKFSGKFIREIKIEENGTHIIVCKVINIYLPEDALSEDYSVDPIEANAVAVSGLDTYLSLQSLGKLSYAKPDKKVEWLLKN
jgi:flavin reductase (DIM6/NTAB) family NADH-FMN oxidoreductase RutF